MICSSLFYAVSIQWSVDLLPQILLSVGSDTPSLRIIDTVGVNPIIVHNSGIAKPIANDESIYFATLPRLKFISRVVRANFADAPQVLPVRPRSRFSSLSIGDGFMITPRHFFPLIRNPDKSVLCAPGSSFVEAMADTNYGWEMETVEGNRILIDSASPDIFLSLSNSGTLLPDILLALDVLEYRYVFDSATGKKVIENCQVDILNDLLPAMKFSVKTVDGGFADIVFEPREYMRSGPGGVCHLGIGFSDYVAPRIGAVMFRKYAVSFSARRRSIGFCPSV